MPQISNMHKVVRIGLLQLVIKRSVIVGAHIDEDMLLIHCGGLGGCKCSSNLLDHLMPEKREIEGVAGTVMRRNSENAEECSWISTWQGLIASINGQRVSAPVELQTVAQRIGGRHNIRLPPGHLFQTVSVG